MGRAKGVVGWVGFAVLMLIASFVQRVSSHGKRPLARIAIHETVSALDGRVSMKAFLQFLEQGLRLTGHNVEWVLLEYSSLNPTNDDWIGVFSPANFSASICLPEHQYVITPLLCSVPIKVCVTFVAINSRLSSVVCCFNYCKCFLAVSICKLLKPCNVSTGKGSLKFQLISQRSDFSFALFSGCIDKQIWTVTWTWTSGYGIAEAEPFVEWDRQGGEKMRSPAGTLTFDRRSMCVTPARTVGWRDPGFIHISFLKELWPNCKYYYQLGHKLFNSSYIWKQKYRFRASPYPGQNSLQRVVIFGDMGKDEVDGSNGYFNFQHGSLNTTYQLLKDLDHIDIAFHIEDISYAIGHLSQWDQFIAQVEPIASRFPYMIASGNHERDWPGAGSFYGNLDSGEKRAKFWYSTDYGMFRFCIADTEHDWREGTDQYKFIEHCLASVDQQKQPWLIFLVHRVLGYSSDKFYAGKGSFGEPMGWESLQKLWPKYKVDIVDIGIYGHVHNYERTCPIYRHILIKSPFGILCLSGSHQNICTNEEKSYYKGALNGTIHIVAGGGGATLLEFTSLQTKWSLFKDYDYGFVKLTALDQSNLLFEYKKSSNGRVYDSFRISRDYRDI
ncbi:hypothetical protein BT93_G1513 [Corymbia citriodora subsp. variegata]|nr:hypothetical protein BT93_G1513 [Corymbia citriodora subsp. variegata]